MKKRIFRLLSLILIVTMILSGCNKVVSSSNNSSAGKGTTESVTADGTTEEAKTSDNTSTDGTKSNSTSAEASNNGTKNTAAATTLSTTSKIVVDKEFTARDLEIGYEDSTATHISLNKNSIKVSGDGATANGSIVTIKNEGSYVINGTLEDGQIIIDAGKSDKVHLVLNGVSINCNNNAPIYIKNADKVFITLKAGSKNTLTDGTEYTKNDENTVDSVIFSKSDLTLNGTGSLSITAKYKHGIVSKNDLIITGGSYTINAVKDTLNGKNSVKIKDGTFHLSTSKGNGIQSKNDKDTTKGYVYICGGTITISKCVEGIEGTAIVIDGGSIDITATDDGLNAASSNTDVTTKSQPDSTKASQDSSSTKTDTNSTKSSKDNTSTDADTVSSATTTNQSDRKAPGNAPTEGNNRPANPPQGNPPQGDMSQGFGFAGGMDNPFAVDENCYIELSGGTININALGDGIDSNGSIYISGGTIYVSGPTENNNGSLDYNGTAEITGGIVIAAGSSGMAQSFSDTSSQCSLLYNMTSVCKGESKITLTDTNGKEIISFTPEKEYQSVVISTPKLVKGNNYQLICGDLTNEITISSVSTNYGQQSMGGMPGGMGRQKDGF